MTEKRFIVIDDGLDFMVRDTFTGDDLIDADGVADVLNDYEEENEHYKSIFFDIVESALEDKNCRELYCKGILSLFDDANSLNQAREMIKGRLK